MEQDNFKAIHVQPLQEAYLADGSTSLEVGFSRTKNVSDPEVQEILSDVYNVEPEDVTLTSADQKRHRNKASAAFLASRWNSSWDPKADPTLN